MSKAFTKEDSGGDEPLPARPRSSSGEKRYITPEGWKALRDELESLQGPDPEAATLPPMEAGARRKERERRLQYVAVILDEVKVAEPDASQAGRVFFGAWVDLEDEDGARTRYRIVGPDEADVKAGKLSVESPLAKALLGKEVGESVLVDRPRGAVEFTVVSVDYASR